MILNIALHVVIETIHKTLPVLLLYVKIRNTWDTIRHCQHIENRYLQFVKNKIIRPTSHASERERHRQADKQTDRQTDTQTEKEGMALPPIRCNTKNGRMLNLMVSNWVFQENKVVQCITRPPIRDNALVRLLAKNYGQWYVSVSLSLCLSFCLSLSLSLSLCVSLSLSPAFIAS